MGKGLRMGDHPGGDVHLRGLEGQRGAKEGHHVRDHVSGGVVLRDLVDRRGVGEGHRVVEGLHAGDHRGGDVQQDLGDQRGAEAGHRVGAHVGGDVVRLDPEVLRVAWKIIEAAAELLQAWAALLARRWLLRLQPSSLECMAPARNAVWHDPPAAIAGCTLVRAMSVLGHCISYEDDVLVCVANTERALWRAYWGVAGGAQGTALGQGCRLRQVSTVFRPILTFATFGGRRL